MVCPIGSPGPSGDACRHTSAQKGPEANKRHVNTHFAEASPRRGDYIDIDALDARWKYTSCPRFPYSSLPSPSFLFIRMEYFNLSPFTEPSPPATSIGADHSSPTNVSGSASEASVHSPAPVRARSCSSPYPLNCRLNRPSRSVCTQRTQRMQRSPPPFRPLYGSTNVFRT